MVLTPWFTGKTPPVREGWYEFRAFFYGEGYKTFMAYYYPELQTFHMQLDQPGFAISVFDKWRGVFK